MATKNTTPAAAGPLTETIQWIPAGECTPDTERNVLVLAIAGGQRYCGTGFYVSMHGGTWRDARSFPWGDGEVLYWAEIPRGPSC